MICGEYGIVQCIPSPPVVLPGEHYDPRSKAAAIETEELGVPALQKIDERRFLVDR